MADLAENIPAAPAPPGEVSNLTNPYSLHRYDVVTQTVCFTMATLLVSMRIYTKTMILRHPGWDDYVSVLAWLGLMGYMIIVLEEDVHGNGKHLWNVSLPAVARYAKLAIISEIIYTVVIFLTKLSILLLYLRVFRPARKLCLAIHLLLWANLLFYVADFLVEVFQCNPRRKAWDVTHSVQGTCIDQRAAQLASAIINTFSDLAILAVSIGMIWKLQIPLKKKLGTVPIFCTGLL